MRVEQYVKTRGWHSQFEMPTLKWGQSIKYIGTSWGGGVSEIPMLQEIRS